MMSLVEETLSDRRSMSEASRIVGKDEKSSGRSMNRVTVKIRIASAKEAASPISSTQDGTGRIIMAMIAISASARSTVGWKSRAAVRRGMAGPDRDCGAPRRRAKEAGGLARGPSLLL